MVVRFQEGLLAFSDDCRLRSQPDEGSRGGIADVRIYRGFLQVILGELDDLVVRAAVVKILQLRSKRRSRARGSVLFGRGGRVSLGGRRGWCACPCGGFFSSGARG